MKKNIRKVILAFLLSTIAIFALAGTALADDPTNITVSWDGPGMVGGTVDTGDAIGTFMSQGNWHTGTFTATDSNNNPYGYGVDNNAFSLSTAITGGGAAFVQIDRATSKTSMYGAAGQTSYASVMTTDGNATLDNRSRTNFADMIDGNYGWHANDQITVTGSSYFELVRSVSSGTGNSAEFDAYGSGDASLTNMSSEARASNVKFGLGAGCYTNAHFNANGSGSMQFTATGNNGVATAMAPGMTGADYFNFIAGWNGSFNIADYSTTAN